MKRLRLYLDTWVISYLTATDAPERMDDTLELWNFKHFVNIKTINRVNSVNLLLGYEVVKIIPPALELKGKAWKKG